MNEECWMCGSDKKPVTKHHVLKREWMPVHNGTIPLCHECHALVHGGLSETNVFRFKKLTTRNMYKKILDLKIRNNKLQTSIGIVNAKPFNGSNWVRFK